MLCLAPQCQVAWRAGHGLWERSFPTPCHFFSILLHAYSSSSFLFLIAHDILNIMSTSTAISHIVLPDERGFRVDRLLVLLEPNISRASVQRALKSGHVRVNDAVVKPSVTVKPGDALLGYVEERAPLELVPDASLTIPVLFENDQFVVIDKPSGISAHPSSSEPRGTVANWFAAHAPAALGVGENPLRPGIVHRLDRETSGVMVLAKNARAFASLKGQFQARSIRKTYMALVFGHPPHERGVVSLPIVRSAHDPTTMAVVRLSEHAKSSKEARALAPMGREAHTEYVVDRRYEHPLFAALLEVHPKTGRMHQIRVHLHSIGFPIIGDAKYVRKECVVPKEVEQPPRLLLHARSLAFEDMEGKAVEFASPLPDDFRAYLSLFS